MSDARAKLWAQLRGYLRDGFGGTDYAYVDEALDYVLAVRDLEWRMAVKALPNVPAPVIDALLAAMEAK